MELWCPVCKGPCSPGAPRESPRFMFCPGCEAWFWDGMKHGEGAGVEGMRLPPDGGCCPSAGSIEGRRRI